MNLNYKYRMYPNKAQANELESIIETHRRLWNYALAEREDHYKTTGKSLSYFTQTKNLTQRRKSDEYLSKCNARSLNLTLRRLEKAFAAFFRRLKEGEKKAGYPRFKARGELTSFAIINGNGCKVVSGDKLSVTGVGMIKVKWHRSLPDDSVVKQVVISKEGSKWYSCFLIETAGNNHVKPCGTGEVGVDLGLETFATTSDGESLGTSRNLEGCIKRIKSLQRKKSRCKRGSARRRKLGNQIASIHASVKNRRSDTHKKTASYLLDSYETVVVEDLNVAGMLKNKHLARRISDAGWAGFVSTLESQAARRGGTVVRVNPAYTSQDCSSCGKRVKKPLSQRSHNCPYCGISLHRDHNAAKNILKKAAAVS